MSTPGQPPALSAPAWQRQQTRKLRWLGLIFLIVIALLLLSSVAFYQKFFTPAEMITLRAESLGTPVEPPTSVKFQGVRVGEVRSLGSDGRAAIVKIALDPAAAKRIPSNVEARVVSTTLLGERVIELLPPEQPSPRHIKGGDVIAQDRTQSGPTIGSLLSQAAPLVNTIKPEQLNATLNALSTALEGRGERLGATLIRADEVVRQLSPYMPTIFSTLNKAGTATQTLGDLTPDLVRTLQNSQPLLRTLTDERYNFPGVLSDGIQLANAADALLRENGGRLITVTRLNRPVLDLVAAYSPTLPCVIDALPVLLPRVYEAFSNERFNTVAELMLPRDKYVPGEEPVNADRSSPNCRGLPNPPVPFPGVKLNDGTRGNTGAAIPLLSPESQIFPSLFGPIFPQGLAGTANESVNLAGTADERRVVNKSVAPLLGVPVDLVPSLATLLLGPMAR